MLPKKIKSLVKELARFEGGVDESRIKALCLEQRLEYRRLGSGAFSTVFCVEKYPDIAIKVNRSSDDACTLYYLEACRNNTKRKSRASWMPEVLMLTKRGRSGFVAVMPRYRAGGSSEDMRARCDVKVLLDNATKSGELGFVDIHNANVMLDREGNTILTDPVATR